MIDVIYRYLWLIINLTISINAIVFVNFFPQKTYIIKITYTRPVLLLQYYTTYIYDDLVRQVFWGCQCSLLKEIHTFRYSGTTHHKSWVPPPKRSLMSKSTTTCRNIRKTLKLYQCIIQYWLKSAVTSDRSLHSTMGISAAEKCINKEWWNSKNREKAWKKSQI